MEHAARWLGSRKNPGSLGRRPVGPPQNAGGRPRGRSGLGDGELLAGQDGCQLRSRSDAELREDPVQVEADRPMREEELLADVAVGQAVGGKLGDLELLWGELIECIGGSGPARLARGAQLDAGPLTLRDEAEPVKSVASSPQRHTRFSHPAPSPKPRSVGQLEPCPGEGPARQIGVERDLEQVPGLLVDRKLCPCIAQAEMEPRRRHSRCDSLQFRDDRTRLVGVTTVDSCLDQVADRPAAGNRVKGRIGRLEDPPEVRERVGIPPGRQRGKAAAVLDGGHHAGRTESRGVPLDRFEQCLGLLGVTTGGGHHGSDLVRPCHEEGLAGLGGESRTLVSRRRRHTPGPEIDSHPCLADQCSGEEAQSALGSQAGDRGGEELRGEIEGADPECGGAEEARRDGVVGPFTGVAGQLLEDDPAPVERCEGLDLNQSRIACWQTQPLGSFHHATGDLVVGDDPPAPLRGHPQ